MATNPFDLVAFVTKRNGGSPSLDLSAMLVQLIKTSAASPNEVGQILDDHSICISCTIPIDDAAPVVSVTPHTIELVPAHAALEVEAEGWWKFPWSSGEKLRKDPQPVIAKKVRLEG